jgi:hypothetical protein
MNVNYSDMLVRAILLEHGYHEEVMDKVNADICLVDQYLCHSLATEGLEMFVGYVLGTGYGTYSQYSS